MIKTIKIELFNLIHFGRLFFGDNRPQKEIIKEWVIKYFKKNIVKSGESIEDIVEEISDIFAKKEIGGKK